MDLKYSSHSYRLQEKDQQMFLLYYLDQPILKIFFYIDLKHGNIYMSL